MGLGRSKTLWLYCNGNACNGNTSVVVEDTVDMEVSKSVNECEIGSVTAIFRGQAEAECSIEIADCGVRKSAASECTKEVTNGKSVLRMPNQRQ